MTPREGMAMTQTDTQDEGEVPSVPGDSPAMGSGDPAIRVRVYTVDAATGARTLLRDQVLATDGPLKSQQYPPCECPRCVRPAAQRQAA